MIEQRYLILPQNFKGSIPLNALKLDGSGKSYAIPQYRENDASCHTVLTEGVEYNWTKWKNVEVVKMNDYQQVYDNVPRIE